MMRVELALYQPDMPTNTGALMRLCACLSVRLHVIHPLGFAFSRDRLRRTGLDYLDHVDFIEHASFAAFEAARRAEGRRLVLLTTGARQSVYDHSFSPGDILMMGRESAGVPEDVAARADFRLRIPMRENLRSINVALAAGISLSEAMRQTEAFKELT